ncbi:MAG: hypothetical protein AAGH40_02945 [Verrucomicrobiota bacterium]
MKFILPILLLGIGFTSGWFISNQRMNEKIKDYFPESMRASLNEAEVILGEMPKEEVKEHFEQMRNFSERVFKEMDYMTLWRGTTANQFLLISEDNSHEAALEYARETILTFRKDYEEGIDVGDWQEMADNVYESTNRLNSEPDAVVNASAAAGKPANHLHD